MKRIDEVGMEYEIETKSCVSRGECHPETCNHWNCYLTKNGKRLMGSDDIERIEEILEELTKKDDI